MNILQIKGPDSIGLKSILKTQQEFVIKEKETLEEGDIEKFQVFFFGINDAGENSSRWIDLLVKIVENGKSILFTHGNPDPYLILDEESEKMQNEYFSKLSSLGIRGYEYGKDRFYSKAKFIVPDEMRLSPNKMKPELEIQETHTLGWIYDINCLKLATGETSQIKIEDLPFLTLRSNLPGKVAFLNIGHNEFGKIKTFTEDEIKLLINTLTYLGK